MTHFFIDTNVVIDFLADRKPFSLEAARLFNYAIKKEIRIYISAVSYNNIYYILRRQTVSHTETIKLLAELTEFVEIADVTQSCIKKAMKSDFKDFEDAIQYQSALTIDKLNAIVTRNTKDFKKSSLPTLTPDQALSLLK